MNDTKRDFHSHSQCVGLGGSYTLGIDIGTCSLKIGAVDVERGELSAWSSSEYQLRHPQPGFAEIDANCYWEAFIAGISELKKTIDLKKIRALAISSQGQTFVPIDRNGNTLQPAWTWIDARSEKQAMEINEKLSRDEIFRAAGVDGLSSGSLAAMIKNIRDNNPALIAETWKFLVTSSYLIWRLTGRAVMDNNLAGISGLYDSRKNVWWKEMLEIVGIDDDLLPEVIPSGTSAGTIDAKIARETGLSDETIVVTGCNDQPANAIGAGLVDTSTEMIVLGTALIACRLTGESEYPKKGDYEGIMYSSYPIAGMGYELGYTNSGCGTFGWAKQLLAPNESYDEVFAKLESVPIGSDGISSLIDLDGRAGVEGMNYRGILAGLSRKSDRWSILRAIMESVAFSIRELTEAMGWSLEGKEIHAVGGGARSDLWMDIHANVLKTPMRRLAHEQSGVVGSAIIAAVGAGIFETYHQAVNKIVHLSKSFNPDRERQEKYDHLYKKFKQLRKAGNLFHQK